MAAYGGTGCSRDYGDDMSGCVRGGSDVNRVLMSALIAEVVRASISIGSRRDARRIRST